MAQPKDLVIPAGLEAKFGALLDGLASDVPAGFEWQSADVARDRVTIQFGPLGAAPAGCDRAELCLLLLHDSLAEADDLQGAGFAIRIAHFSTPQWESVGRTVAARIADGLGAWSGEQVAQAWTEVADKDLGPLLVLILVLMGIGLLALAGLAVQEWRNVPWVWVGAGLFWSVGCFALCWWLAPHGVFHDNHHGYSFLTAVEFHTNPSHIVVSSFLAFAQVIHGVFGGGDELFWGINTGLMALSSPLLGWWIAAASGRRNAGILAAAMWGISPWALRMGPTDTLFTFSAVLLLASALLLGLALKRFETSGVRGIMPLVGAVALAALAGQTHVPAMFLPPMVLPMALAMRAVTCRRQKLWLLGGVVAVAGLLIPPGLAVLEMAMHGEGNRFIEAGNLVTLFSWSRRILWSGTWVAWSVAPLALFGLVVTAIRSRRAGLWLAASWGGILVGQLTIATCQHLHVSMELPLGCVTTGLAGLGACLLMEGISSRLTGWKGAVASGGMGAVAVASVLQPWPVVDFQPPATQEYRFLQSEVLPYLGQRSSVRLLVPGSLRLEGYPRMPLPRTWLEARLPSVHVFSSKQELADDGNGGPDYVYLGLSCMAPREGSDGAEGSPVDCQSGSGRPRILSSQCEAELAGWKLTPVKLMRITHEPEGFLCVGFPNENLDVGLFQVVERPSGGPR